MTRCSAPTPTARTPRPAGSATPHLGRGITRLRIARLAGQFTRGAGDQALAATDLITMAAAAALHLPRLRARSAGRAAEVGRIDPGCKADLMLVDRHDYGPILLKAPPRQLVHGVNSDAVQSLIVDGRVVMADRRLTRVDEAALKAEIAEEAARYLRDHVPVPEALAPPL